MILRWFVPVAKRMTGFDGCDSCTLDILVRELTKQRAFTVQFESGTTSVSAAFHRQATDMNVHACTGSRTPPCPYAPCQSGAQGVAFSLSGQDRHTKVVPCSCVLGGSSVAGLRYRSHGRLRQFRFANRPSAEGRSNWLNFLRKILSFSIPNRFIPAHPDTFFNTARSLPLDMSILR